MFWTNKNVTVKRISNWVFVNQLTTKCRYSPKKFNSVKELETKQNHITFKMFCDTDDIYVKDKVIDWSRSFIVSWVYDYSDNHWKHLEILMIEMNSRLHETIEIKSLNVTQTNYDTIMWEWIGSKNLTSRNVKVLIDSAKLMKANFIKMIEWWKIEEVELVVTMFFPETIDKSDKIVYNGDTYEIKWIIPFPHQLAIWIIKYIKDYDS